MNPQSGDEWEEYQRFKEDSEWSYDAAARSLRRAPVQGITAEIVDVGNGFYQPIVERVGVGRLSSEPRLCQSLDKAKEYAWTILKEALATFPQDGTPPVAMDM